MSKGNGKKNTKAIWMVAAFFMSLMLVSVEIGLLFRQQWVLFEALMAENPVLIFMIFGPQVSLPMALAMHAGTFTGRRIGEEAEEIARGMRP